MKRRLRPGGLLLPLLMGVALWHGVAIAAAAGAAPPVSVAEARTWLQRIHGAASQRNYEGTLVVTAGGNLSSARMAHYCEAQQSFERVDILDGQVRRVFRHNEQLLTLWPESRLARAGQRDAVALFPSVLSGSAEQIFERYELLAEGSGRVAGHEAAILLLRPRDEMRFAQRLWADRATGLLLRADVLDAGGRVLESAAFSEVSIGVKAQPDTVTQPMRRLEGYRMLRNTVQRTALDGEGWQLKSPVAGFKQVSCVKRGTGTSADASDAGATEWLQAIFSDGLTHVSVFIEPMRSDRHRAGSGSLGATHSLMLANGPYWITVMGDVPHATLKQFAAALERIR